MKTTTLKFLVSLALLAGLLSAKPSWASATDSGGSSGNSSAKSSSSKSSKSHGKAGNDNTVGNMLMPKNVKSQKNRRPTFFTGDSQGAAGSTGDGGSSPARTTADIASLLPKDPGGIQIEDLLAPTPQPKTPEFDDNSSLLDFISGWKGPDSQVELEGVEFSANLLAESSGGGGGSGGGKDSGGEEEKEEYVESKETINSVQTNNPEHKNSAGGTQQVKFGKENGQNFVTVRSNSGDETVYVNQYELSLNGKTWTSKDHDEASQVASAGGSVQAGTLNIGRSGGG